MHFQSGKPPISDRRITIVNHTVVLQLLLRAKTHLGILVKNETDLLPNSLFTQSMIGLDHKGTAVARIVAMERWERPPSMHCE